MIASVQGKDISIYFEKSDVQELDSEGIHSGESVIVTAKAYTKARVYVEIYDRTAMRPTQVSLIEWKNGPNRRECHIKLLRDEFEGWILKAKNHSKRKLPVIGDDPRKNQVIDFNKEGLGRDEISKTTIEKLLQKAA